MRKENNLRHKLKSVQARQDYWDLIDFMKMSLANNDFPHNSHIAVSLLSLCEDCIFSNLQIQNCNQYTRYLAGLVCLNSQKVSWFVIVARYPKQESCMFSFLDSKFHIMENQIDCCHSVGFVINLLRLKNHCTNRQSFLQSPKDC